MAEFNPLSFMFKRPKFLGWFLMIYFLSIVVFMLPKIPSVFRYLIQDYREAFFGAKPAVQTQSTDLADIHQKLSVLEANMTSLRSGTHPDKVAMIKKDLWDLKKTIFGDPESALSIQRLNIEFLNLKEQIAGLRSQNRWLFGITLTLALAVLTALIGVIRSSGLGNKEPEESNN